MSLSSNAITQLERDLLAILKEEYSFYQSLYVLLDKQRDLIKYDHDANLLDIFAETERCQRRIQDSEARISVLREKNRAAFRVALAHPEIKKVVTSMTTLVRKNLDLVRENEQFVADRHARLKAELSTLQKSDKILRYLSDSEPAAHLVDGSR